MAGTRSGCRTPLRDSTEAMAPKLNGATMVRWLCRRDGWRVVAGFSKKKKKKGQHSNEMV